MVKVLVAHQIAADRLQCVPQLAERLVEHLGQLRVIVHAAAGGDEGAEHLPGHVAEFGVGQRGKLTAEEVIGVAGRVLLQAAQLTGPAAGDRVAHKAGE